MRHVQQPCVCWARQAADAVSLLLVQDISLDDLEPQRILFGFFPTYRASPLKPQWDRIVQVPIRSCCASSWLAGAVCRLTFTCQSAWAAVQQLNLVLLAHRCLLKSRTARMVQRDVMDIW